MAYGLDMGGAGPRSFAGKREMASRLPVPTPSVDRAAEHRRARAIGRPATANPGSQERRQHRALERRRAARPPVRAALRPVHRHRQGPGGRHRRRLPLVSRARQPGQPGRPLPARPGHRLGRPGRPAVRPDHRQLRGALGGAQGQCRLCAARRRLPDRARALHSAGRRRQVGGVAVGLPRRSSTSSRSGRSCSTPPSARFPPSPRPA